MNEKLERAEQRYMTHKNSIQEKRGKYSEMLEQRRKEVEEKELQKRAEMVRSRMKAEERAKSMQTNRAKILEMQAFRLK